MVVFLEIPQWSSLCVGCGEGNGHPLQCSCLENPVDRGAWWAAVHGVAQSWTWQKRLSMHACIGEGNGNPLQYSCLENPGDRGAWGAAVYGVAQSQTRLKRFSSSSSSMPRLSLYFLFQECFTRMPFSSSPLLGHSQTTPLYTLYCSPLQQIFRDSQFSLSSKLSPCTWPSRPTIIF